MAERFERLVDVLDVVQSMFRSERTTHHGEHFRADGARNVPPPVQPGGPPTLIGGSGERRTLRLIAERADICNVAGMPERVRQLMQVLDGHCVAVGRDPRSICRTFMSPVTCGTRRGSREPVPEHYRSRGRAGHGHPRAGRRALPRIVRRWNRRPDRACINADRTPNDIAELAAARRNRPSLTQRRDAAAGIEDRRAKARALTSTSPRATGLRRRCRSNEQARCSGSRSPPNALRPAKTLLCSFRRCSRVRPRPGRGLRPT